MVLKETALIEAFNLKAAIEYLMKNHEAAQATTLASRADDDHHASQRACSSLHPATRLKTGAAVLWPADPTPDPTPHLLQRHRSQLLTPELHARSPASRPSRWC